MPRSLRRGRLPRQRSRSAVDVSSRYRLRVADVTLPARARSAHLVPRLERRHADDAEHRPGRRRPRTPACSPATASATAPRPAATRPSASRPTARRATTRTPRCSDSLTASPPTRRACGPASPMPCPTPTSIDEPPGDQLDEVAPLGRRARAPRRRECDSSSRRRPIPSLGEQRRRLVDAPARADARRARGDARARRRGLGLLVVLRDAGRARRCCSTRMPSATSRSRPRPGSRAAAGLLYWSVNDYTGDPYTRRRATTATSPAASATATACSCTRAAARPAGAESVAAPRARRRRPADRRRGGAARAPRPRRRGPRAARAACSRARPSSSTTPRPGRPSSASLLKRPRARRRDATRATC